MKTQILLLLLLGILTGAQTNRFFYEYTFIPDSNNKEDVKKEMMLLDINKSGSTYYSYDKFVSDSTSRADLERQIKSGSGSISVNKKGKPGEVSYKVTKQYPEYKTYLFTSIFRDQYKVREDKKPEWKILPDKQKIGEYDTQKATTNFGGREWTAWFAQDIPFQDGPYKFYGLPGLIVKLEDATGSHIMTLAGNKKIQAQAEEKELDVPAHARILGIGEKELEVSKEQYKKVWKAYVNDPSKNMREMMNRSGGENGKVVFKVKTAEGKEMSDPNEIFKEMDKRAKEGFKKNNNPIEPDLVN
ncbi:MAG: GLPGLI family protein [Chryseobacterium sp.]|jgi:GLPGLI family protein|uniref:GLPGLI family protein n=1 Tax=Chryseobacterium sp. TaxID=1871047 RepID=UPI0028252CA0|nr:GLPGLI family protein [Chryseobacterium sp.]MDR2238020.1 GLPGLI family protein [Chryseobacterium sp.]